MDYAGLLAGERMGLPFGNNNFLLDRETYQTALKVMPPALRDRLNSLENALPPEEETSEIPRIIELFVHKEPWEVWNAFYVETGIFLEQNEVERIERLVRHAIKGVIWSRRFKNFKIKPPLVIDIGNGGDCSFPFALALNGFSGEYVPVDVDETVLARIVRDTRHLKIKCRPMLVGAEEFIKETKKECGLLIFNHVLDDIFDHDFCKEYERGEWRHRQNWVGRWMAAHKYFEKTKRRKPDDKIWLNANSRGRMVARVKRRVGCVSEMVERHKSLIKQLVVGSSDLVASGGYLFIGQWPWEASAVYGIDWPKEFLPELRTELLGDSKFSVASESKKGDLPEDWFVFQKNKKDGAGKRGIIGALRNFLK